MMESKRREFDDDFDPIPDNKHSHEQQPHSAIRSMASSHKRLTVLRCKVVFAGEPGVGKTALCQMFESEGQNFPKNYLMTLGSEILVKQISVPNSNYVVEMYMYDCAGQSVFNQREMAVQNWLNTSVAVIVYDVGSRQSFLAAKKWLTSVRSANKSRNCPGVLVANKTDYRESGRVQVSPQEGAEFAAEEGLSFFETSALRNRGIDELFSFIAHAFCSKYHDAVENAVV